MLFHIFIIVCLSQRACVIHLSFCCLVGNFTSLITTTTTTKIPPREVVEIRTALSETACKPKPAAVQLEEPLFTSIFCSSQNRTDLAHMCVHRCRSKKKQTSSSSSASQAGNIPAQYSHSSS